MKCTPGNTRRLISGVDKVSNSVERVKKKTLERSLGPFSEAALRTN